jgi:GntR family transcriptional repressor for pyruvate dehydrogenase complex
MNNAFITPQSMEPVSGGSVVDNIIQQLRAAIASGRFQMGDKLPTEFALMEELHVSRNSLREAMKILSAMGIVEIRRGDGTYICKEIKPTVVDSVVYSMLLGASNSDEVIELRQTLDEDVMRLAMRKCTQEDIDQLQHYIHQMRYHFSEGEISKAAKMDYQFHVYLCQCCRNRFLSRMVLGIYHLFESSIEKNIRTEKLFAQADQHHQAMVDCLKSKDESRIPQVVAQSLSSWRENVKKGQPD